MNSGLKVVAPASISNLACGYDVLGMAIDVPCDEITGRLTDQQGIRISQITGEKKNIPLEVENNIAGITATALLKHLGEEKRGIELKIHKHIPAGSGMGSSGASATAAAVLVNELLNRPLEKKELIPFAFQGEKTTGSTSGDNIVPEMIGGLVLIRDIYTLDYHRIYTPPGLFVAVVLPDLFLSTKNGREILKMQIALEDFRKQSANLGAFVIGMHTGDFDLIKRSMVDYIIEPQRKHMIPHFDNVKETAMQMGALGCSLSGSGPSIFALCLEKTQASEIADAMKRIYDEHKFNSRVFVGGINHEGARAY